MHKIIVITLLSFFIFSCSNSQGNGKTEVSSTPTKAHSSNDSHAGHDHAEPKHHKSSPLSPFVGIWTYFAATHNPDYYKTFFQK